MTLYNVPVYGIPAEPIRVLQIQGRDVFDAYLKAVDEVDLRAAEYVDEDDITEVVA